MILCKVAGKYFYLTLFQPQKIGVALLANALAHTLNSTTLLYDEYLLLFSSKRFAHSLACSTIDYSRLRTIEESRESRKNVHFDAVICQLKPPKTVVRPFAHSSVTNRDIITTVTAQSSR
jgi:hypothetical protein